MSAVKTLDAAGRLQTRVGHTTETFDVVGRGLLALLAIGLVDILWPLPALLRCLFLIGLFVVSALLLWRRVRRKKTGVSEAQIARNIETLHPELDNALIHAVQFGTLAEADTDNPTFLLMRRERERAEQEAGRLSLSGMVDTVSLRRSRRTLGAVLLFVLLTALLFPRAYRFELPRLFAFWNDAPSFTLTDFSVTPEAARVRSGEGISLTIQVGGLLPHRLELITGRAGEPTQSIPLSAPEGGSTVAQLDNLTRDTWFIVSADTGRSQRYWIRVDTAPVLRRLTVTLRAPTYTKRPETTTELSTEREIKGLPGTQVQLIAESDQPLSGGEMTLNTTNRPETRLSLTPQPGTPYRASTAFTLEQEGTFRLGLRAKDGQQMQEPVQGKITLLRDETPLISFLTPGQNVIAKPDMTVPLTIEAEDDAGLQRLELHRIVNKGTDTAQTIPIPNMPHNFRHMENLDLRQMGAKAGDVIEYYATAYDNDPQGVHNAQTERYWIWIVSEADYKQVLEKQRNPSRMTEQYRNLTESLRQLSEAQAQLAKEMQALAEKAKSAPPGDPQIQKQQEALRKQQQELNQQAKALEKQMREVAGQKPQFDVEKGLQKRLEKLAESLAKAQANRQQAANGSRPGTMSSAAQKAAQQMQQATKQDGQSIEKAVEAIEKTLPLYQDFARLQQLAKEQAQLAQQAQQVRDAVKEGQPDAFAQSRLKSLAEQQEQNQNTLNQIREDLKTHAKEAQPVAPEAAHTAEQLAEAIGQQNISQTMQQAQQSLSRQDTKKGAEQSDTARRALESLTEQGKQGQKQAQKACNGQCLSALGQGAGNSLSQMAQRQTSQSGQGNGSGEGGGQGTQSSYNPPRPGSRPGDAQSQGQGSEQQAMAMGLTRQAGGGVRKQKREGPKGERQNALSDDNTERLGTDPARPLPKATDRDASRYPAEYRRLVRDYFKSVAGSR